MAFLSYSMSTCCHASITSSFVFMNQIHASNTKREPISRRSANYPPSSWDYARLQHSTNKTKLQGTSTVDIQKLKLQVRQLFVEKTTNPVAMLKLVDTLRRLGVSYHFEEEIMNFLSSISTGEAYNVDHDDIFVCTTKFKLLRQHGFGVSESILKHLKEETGRFKLSLTNDTQALLSLYEASHLACEGETLLDDARICTTKLLLDLKAYINNPQHKSQVIDALEMPLHWRPQRLEARRYIAHLEVEKIDPFIIDLAKLEFNMGQKIHHDDLKNVARWWQELGLKDNLSFARDRSTEIFFFATGIIHESHLQYARRELAKLAILIATVDDVYDIYGTPEELELFTRAIKKWDYNDVLLEKLPDYMKAMYLALCNTTSKTAEYIQSQHGWDALPCIRKAWEDLCNSFLVEAKWQSNSKKPTLEEYLNNGWVSSSGQFLLVYTFSLLGQETTMHFPENNSGIIHSAAMILRLCNDLATSEEELKRGDSPSSLDCYMRQYGVSGPVAREAIKDEIFNTWKRLNTNANELGLVHQRQLANSALNLARISQCIYHNRDGIGFPDEEKMSQVKSLFFEPLT